MVLASLGKAQGRAFDFATPSQEALAVNLAHRASRDAMALRKELALIPTPHPIGPGPRWQVADESHAALYDYFESCFATVVFSYQAIEACANRIIDHELPSADSTLRHPDRADGKSLGAADLQRLRTATKLKEVLPRLVASIQPLTTVRSLWDAFTQLERERDAVLHLKAQDAYPRDDRRTPSIYHRFLDKGVGRHPVTAVKVLLHLHPGEHGPWLDGAVALLGGAVE